MAFSPSTTAPFANSLDHLKAELERIDLLIQAHVSRARRMQKADEFQGLYVSEQEVDELLQRPAGLPRWASQNLTDAELEIHRSSARLAGQIAGRASESRRNGLFLPLLELTSRFGLTSFDANAVLICLALEVDCRYERLYAYLQDDVTRKRPGVDLILNLLCPDFDERVQQRARFSAGAPLIDHQLIVLGDDGSQTRAPLAYRSVQLDERVANYLLLGDAVDGRLVDTLRIVTPLRKLSELVLPTGLAERLDLLAEALKTWDRVTVYLQGPAGVGKQSVAEALAHKLGVGLLAADLEQMGSNPGDFRGSLRLVMREARLRGAALYLAGFDALMRDEQRLGRMALVEEIRKHPGLVLLGGQTLWEPGDMPEGHGFARVELSFPGYPERLQLWKEACNGSATHELISDLAGKFRLSGGQIRDAAATARQLALSQRPDDSKPVRADFHEACRLHSNRRLTALARRIKPQYRWNDIVLPPDRVEQLREICSSLQFRHVVYGEWGFDKKLALGKGTNVLFAGPSGTGKTMAAEILAGELGLELYKTDLSTIVSKYIGETEKNLARIFSEAASSNAILFFDEADALFGKRSEVRDSHDRYANIEVNYLLQEMERYEGIAILATNLRKNMDEAFVRRMHFVVEFPFPDVNNRLRIWQGVLPDETPRNADLDLEFLAAAFEITGGNIRNVALGAAFLAASAGMELSMTQMIRAMWREYQKMGKVISEKEFGPYYDLAGIE